ncbi:MAG TPA: aspartate aminotransferase family protein [Solirubrobacterales bacterium]|nr:aspartate aminotransferase family protein [Solirubrobacterales bacterium]
MAEVAIVEGRGSYLIDDRQRRYLDFVSGYGVSALGHANPHWVEVVTRQAARLCVSPFHSPVRASYLERLGEVLPPELGRTSLFSGGAEAVEAAVRLAQQATGRDGVLAFRSAFHGKTAGVRFAGASAEEQRTGLAPSWLHHAKFPACRSHSASRYEVCEESPGLSWARLGEGLDLAKVSCVIVEPVLGTAGNIPPQRRFFSELRAACDDRGWLLIFDESQTGFGRTGSMFASDLFGVVPDIMVTCKGMGGGFPLSGVAASPDLWSAGSLDRPSATSTSFGGNPLACAAGGAVLDVLAQPSFLGDMRRVAFLLAAGLDELAATSPYASWSRGVGMMLGFDLVDPQTGDLADRSFCGQVFRRCRDMGLLLAADVPRVRLSPPLTLSEEEARQALAILKEALS